MYFFAFLVEIDVITIIKYAHNKCKSKEDNKHV